MLLCVAAGTAGLLIQAEFGLTQTAGRHLFWGGGITLEMRLLIWSLFCDPEWNQHTSLSPHSIPHPNPPLLRERRVESWTPNTTFLKDYIPFSRPSFFFFKSSLVRSRRVGHYFPSAVVPPTLSRGSLPQPAPAEGDARRARNYASGWGGGVVLAAARWRQRPELRRGLRRRVEIC